MSALRYSMVTWKFHQNFQICWSNYWSTESTPTWNRNTKWSLLVYVIAKSTLFVSVSYKSIKGFQLTLSVMSGSYVGRHICRTFNLSGAQWEPSDLREKVSWVTCVSACVRCHAYLTVYRESMFTYVIFTPELWDLLPLNLCFQVASKCVKYIFQNHTV